MFQSANMCDIKIGFDLIAKAQHRIQSSSQPQASTL